MYEIIKELDAIDRMNQRKSLIYTTIIMVVLMLLSILWRAYRASVKPPEDEYVVMGSIDFGNMTMGSQRVNNYEPPTPDPSPPPKPAETAPSEPEPEPEAAPEPVITQEDPSPVTQPKVEPKKEPKPKPKQTTPKPTPKPKTESKPKEEPKKEEAPKTPPRELPKFETSTGSGGSNDGTNDSGTGNKGKPAQTLDPNGMYTFGSGSGTGKFNRGAIKLGYPNYNVQEEGEVKFKFIIAPNGSVINAQPVPPILKPSLVRLGKATIMRWKFSPIPRGKPQANQTVTVTMRFKLTN